jgi:hypothetical protein
MSSYSMTIHSSTVGIVRGTRVPSGSGVVVMETVEVTTLHPRKMGKLELPPLLEAVSPLSVGSLRIVCSDGDPL